MSKRRLIYSLAILYVILLSFLPIINDLETVSSWVGYGWGNYRYTTEKINVVYQGISIDGGILKIEVRPPHQFSKYITLFVLDEREIKPHNLTGANTLKLKSLRPLNKNTLLAMYEGAKEEVSELVEVSNDGGVHLEILCNSTCNITILLKHYYLRRAKQFNLLSEEGKQEIIISYGFDLNDKLFKYAEGNISVTAVASRISFLRDNIGIYGIKVSPTNSDYVNITIHKIHWLGDEEKDPPSSILEWILTTKTAHVSYIIIALIISVIWWKRWMREGS